MAAKICIVVQRQEKPREQLLSSGLLTCMKMPGTSLPQMSGNKSSTRFWNLHEVLE